MPGRQAERWHRSTGSRCRSLATSLDPLGFFRRWVRTWHKRLPGRHWQSRGGMAAGVVEAGWGHGTSDAQHQPSFFPLLHLNPFCLFIHERLSYLQSIILRGFFHPKRFQVSSNQPPPSCQAAGHLVTQGFLFWQPCHPRLPGEFSLGFNEMFVLHQEAEVAFSRAALLLLPSFAGPRHHYTPQARSLRLLQQHGLVNHRPAFPS